MISVVIPTLNAEAHLPATFLSISMAAINGLVGEVIVSDGGSSDHTQEIAEAAGATVLATTTGRGEQLRAGAKLARKPWLLFLHSDTCLAEGWEEDAKAFMETNEDRAAAFRFKLADSSVGAKMLETLVSLRCGLFRLPYGDQGMLISRRLYNDVGGFSPLPLMEDVDLIRRLGRSRIRMLKAAAVTSAERFQQEGYIRRSARNLSCLALYMSGVSAERLARYYG